MRPAKVEPWILELSAYGFGGTASGMLRCWLPPIAGPKPLPDSWCHGLLSPGIDKRWRPGRTYFPENHFGRKGGSTQQNESSGRVRQKSTHPGATWPEGIRCTLSGSEFVALRARHRCRASVQKQRPKSAYPRSEEH